MDTTPTRQLPAGELIKRGITVPYWHPADKDHLPVVWHVTLPVLQRSDIDRLVINCRKHAARINPNPHDNRNGNLDYPATEREMVNFIKHSCINRTEKTAHHRGGYHNSYDAIMRKIAAGGVDVVHRQTEFKLLVLRLIATHYPYLKDECDQQAWLTLNPRTGANNHAD